MPALALTDHGNMFGAIDFYEAAKARGIKPVMGYEAYVTQGSRLEKESKNGKESLTHITLLAENNEGYKNLLKLATSAYLDGFYYKPRIDKAFLATHSKGIICLSGCMTSEINRCLLNNRSEEALKAAKNIRISSAQTIFYRSPKQQARTTSPARFRGNGNRQEAGGTPCCDKRRPLYEYGRRTCPRRPLVHQHGKHLADVQRLRFGTK